MKLLTYCAVILTGTFASGCVSTLTLKDASETRIENIDNKNYELGRPAQAYVGQPLIARKKYKIIVKTNDALKAENNFKFTGGIGATSAKVIGSEGDSYRVMGVNEKGNLVIALPGTNMMIGIGSNGQWDQTVMTNSFWTSPVGGSSGSGYSMEPASTVFSATKKSSVYGEDTSNYINHELVYTGLSNFGISLLYREYTFSDIARAPFTQQLNYPSSSQYVRFRDYKLRLLSVTPESINYVVETE